MEGKPTAYFLRTALRISIREPMYAVSVCPIDHGEDLMASNADVLQVLVRHRAKVLNRSALSVVTLHCVPESTDSFCYPGLGL